MHRSPKLTGRHCFFKLGLIAFAVLVVQSSAIAGDVKIEAILSGLKAPCGVAVRPNAAGGAIEIFVADRGAGRVVQVDGDKPGASTVAISDFPVGAASAGAAPCAPGVQSLLFLDHARLVAAGGDKNSKPLLRLYDLADSDGPLKADQHKQDLDLPSGGAKSDSGLSCFHDVIRTRPNDRVADMLVMAASTDRGSAGLWKVPVRANTLGDAVAFRIAKKDVQGSAAGGLAVANDGYIAVANRAESKSDALSSLKYVNPIDGRVTLEIEVKLPRIVALAYHPTSRNLYAASLAGSDWPGGIYRIDDASEQDKRAANPIKVAYTARPTAMAFGPDGALYVSALGSNDDKGNDAGALIKISGEL